MVYRIDLGSAIVALCFILRRRKFRQKATILTLVRLWHHALPYYSAAPISIVSATDPDSAIPLAQQKGLNGFICKPISPRIVDYAEAVIGGKSVWIANTDF